MPIEIIDTQDISIEDDDILNDPEYRHEIKILEEKIYSQTRQLEKETYSNFLIMDHVPMVNEEKLPKLLSVLKKILSQFGPLKEEGIFLPHRNENGHLTTQGYAFVEFEDEASCNSAIENLDQYPLDKQHILALNKFVDFEDCVSVDDTFVAPKVEEYHEMEHLCYWLRDERARDQFLLRYAEETVICVNNGGGSGIDANVSAPDVAYKRINWTEGPIQWSSLGFYIATFHRQGVALWGGPTWKQIMRFPHPDASKIDFSPLDTYCITGLSNVSDEDIANTKKFIVWDMKTGKEIRAFQGSKDISWPGFKWSHDEKYVAKAGENGLFIYELPSMQLLEKKSIKIENLQEFEWSPSDNYIAYWSPESPNAPARVTIMEIPSRTITRTMNLFNVIDCKLLWKPLRDYLAVKIERYTGKSRKPTHPNIEIFRLRERDIPVEVIELKEPIVSFAWEPKGSHLIIIHGSGDSTTKNNVSLYSIEAKKGASGIIGHVHLLKTLEKKSVSEIYWSPEGQFVVLAGMKQFNGVLEFWNIRDLEMMVSAEHYMATNLQWDPSGRFVISTVSAWHHRIETGYCLWDFRGKLIYKKLMERFYEALWRPRPPTLLNKEKQKEIRKNIKEFSREFEELDDMLRNQMSLETIEERRKLADEWRKFIQTCEEKYLEEHDARAILRGYESNDEEDYEMTEEIIEELINETTEYLD
jgi:translation initiation factor 3 subunit B